MCVENLGHSGCMGVCVCMCVCVCVCVCGGGYLEVTHLRQTCERKGGGAQGQLVIKEIKA